MLFTKRISKFALIFLNDMEGKSTFLIDIDNILKNKMGKNSKFLPRFVVSYLKRIIHQDEINSFISDNKDKVGVDFLESCVKYFGANFEVEGIENLPKNQLCTFVSNHPLGGLDGVVLGYILGKHYEGKVKYLVNDLLMHVQGLAPMFIPINKTGNQSKDFPAMVDAGFNSDNHMIIFPAGLCSRRVKGKIVDLEWKKTFIVKSIQTKRVIVPIHFEGRNSNFFYNLANFSKTLGIKFNIAMLYLADEMFNSKNKTFKIKIGKPIDYKVFDKTKSPKQWAEYVKNIVYGL